MAKAIEQLATSGWTVGHAALGMHGAGPGSVKQQTHDGDTVIVQAVGNLGVRFLGVDAPEISFTLPNSRAFIRLADERWEEFLRDPFAPTWPPFEPSLSSALVQHLSARVGPGAAMNHHLHASAAEDALEATILNDLAALGQTAAEFRFFLVFAHEVMDGYGRLLCYLNRDQPDANVPEPRPRSYNERLLQMGMVSPYFIWPNINPFLAQKQRGSLLDAVPPPGTAHVLASSDQALRDARQSVQHARQQGLGIYQAQNPLRLQPFEVRFLARRRPPERWVIDLSRDDDVLIRPQDYHRIPHVEDRLFIPPEYVPLFVEAGWRRQTC
jgi:endonuclease YncB( thermonuclease family)